MTVYQNVPLVELIAELRWEAANPFAAIMNNVQLPPGMIPSQMPFMDQAAVEQLVSQFANFCQQDGNVSVERLQPAGFPLMPSQVSHRFKVTNTDTEIYQIGPGVFTVNAIPPYSSWESFRGFLERGVRNLIASRPKNEAEQKFQVSVQYINAFGPALVGDSNFQSFLENVIGFKLSVPDAIQGLVAEGAAMKTNLQLRTELSNGMYYNCQINEGQANNEDALIVHTNVFTDSSDVLPVLEDVMASLDEAHRLQHEMFLGFTAGVQETMRGN